MYLTKYFLFSMVLFLSSELLSATKFLVFGDFGTGDDEQRLVARDMKSYCDQKGCDFAVTVGDNIYPQGVPNIFNGQKSYDAGQPDYRLISSIFVDMYKPLNMPFYMSYGNHDVGNEGVVSIFKDFFKNEESIKRRTITLMSNQLKFMNDALNPAVKNSLGGTSKMWYFADPYYFVKEKDNVNLFAIDTNSYPHQVLAKSQEFVTNPKNFAQQQWLKDGLQKVTGWKIVFGHMPLYSHGHHGWQNMLALQEFRDAILSTLCENKVDLYLAGHDHHLEIDRHRCGNGHEIVAIISGAAAKSDRVYQRSFPLISSDENLIWANGKFYKNSKLIYKNEDNVLGFSHIAIDGNKAKIIMKLSKGQSSDRTNACFEVTKGQAYGQTLSTLACQ